jgi:H+/Cl- antiporter ClcA
VNWKAVAAATFGYVVALIIIAAITFDIEQVKHHLETISRWTLSTAERYPIWVCLAWALPLLFYGALLGHLFFPQRP